MSTVTQIANALMLKLSTLPGVDQASIDVYLPPVETESIALLITPFRQESRVESLTATRSPLMQSHRINCEFWVKVNVGDIAGTVAKAREIGLMAIRELVKDQSMGGVVSRVGHFGAGSNQLSITTTVDANLTRGGQVDFIVCAVLVPVIDYADGI